MEVRSPPLPLPGQLALGHSLLHNLSNTNLDDDQIKDDKNVGDSKVAAQYESRRCVVQCIEANALNTNSAWICQAG